MKKTTLTLATSLLLLISGLKAQSIQEGMNHLYAGRIKSAVTVFEKMLAVNPNNIEATYWLGQSLLETDEIMGARLVSARELYDKALKSSSNAPLVLVGMGHVELLENKPNDARQHFEMALTMSRNSRRGDDPVIQTAIGRAIADSKTGDFKYAVDLLKSATSKDPKNTETLLQLGNAHRKAGDGTGGGEAFLAYKKALEVNPSFAVASFRLAQIFASQKNWEPFLQYLNEAITKDSKFTLAYYQLFYDSWFRKMDYPEAEKYLNKYIESKLPEKDIQDEYLYGQLCWGRKDFECAVSRAETVVKELGDKTKPKIYRLLADAYYQKADYGNAKRNSDAFFAKKNPEDITLYDYQLRADILAKSGATDVEVLDTYMQG
ncbi:MAG: tetratricopeptide repeat protein, partial [Bacteroidota bacterium]